jgi:hypothetical protein
MGAISYYNSVHCWHCCTAKHSRIILSQVISLNFNSICPIQKHISTSMDERIIGMPHSSRKCVRRDQLKNVLYQSAHLAAHSTGWNRAALCVVRMHDHMNTPLLRCSLRWVQARPRALTLHIHPRCIGDRGPLSTCRTLMKRESKMGMYGPMVGCHAMCSAMPTRLSLGETTVTVAVHIQPRS